ncbi:YjbQ family protein [candidate division WOR-3 bacterium]|nr:YjbQ family protein [candidate division WOR-3 bacterium]
MVSIEVATRSRVEMVNITPRIQDAVTSTGVSTGVCFIHVPHTTAGVTVNEAFDPDVAADVSSALSRLVPYQAGYAHSEGNADAHIKSVLVGTSQTIPVEDGRLALGRWQGVFFCEFDGPRRRQVYLTIVSDIPQPMADRPLKTDNRNPPTGG